MARVEFRKQNSVIFRWYHRSVLLSTLSHLTWWFVKFCSKVFFFFTFPSHNLLVTSMSGTLHYLLPLFYEILVLSFTVDNKPVRVRTHKGKQGIIPTQLTIDNFLKLLLPFVRQDCKPSYTFSCLLLFLSFFLFFLLLFSGESINLYEDILYRYFLLYFYLFKYY